MPLPEESMNRFQDGEPYDVALRATRLNQPLIAIEEIRRQINRLPQFDGEADRLSITEHWVGKITDEGPEGEADLEGSQYWAIRQRPLESLGGKDRLSFVKEDVPGARKTVRANNLAEIDPEGGEGAHGVAVDTLCHVFTVEWHRVRDGPATFYFFNHTSGIPAGTGKRKVLSIIDDLDPGTADWDYVRFSEDP